MKTDKRPSEPTSPTSWRLFRNGKTANKFNSGVDGRAPDDPAVEFLVIRVLRVFKGGVEKREELGTWSIKVADRDKKAKASKVFNKDGASMWPWQMLPLPIDVVAISSKSISVRRDLSNDIRAIDLSNNPPEGSIGPTFNQIEFLVEEGTIHRFEIFAGVPTNTSPICPTPSLKMHPNVPSDDNSRLESLRDS
jgi:hypothetical protein